MKRTIKLTMDSLRGMMDKTYTLRWADRDDNLDDNLEVIERCIGKRSAAPLLDFVDRCFLDGEHEAIAGIKEDLKRSYRLAGYKSWVVERFFDGHDDQITEEIQRRDHSDEVMQLLRNTGDIPVRVELHSNYDCINSHHFESQGGYSYTESYFGHMVDALNLNPAKVKKTLLAEGIGVVGRFPDKPSRNGKEYVSYEAFHTELLNSTCGANLLVFLSSISLVELYGKNFDLDRIVIPKGNPCGLFSSAYGGGSLLEMELLGNVELKLHESQYDYFRLTLDCQGKSGYSIYDTYGLTTKYFGGNLKIAS